MTTGVVMTENAGEDKGTAMGHRNETAEENDMDESTPFDLQRADAVLHEAQQKAKHELGPRASLISSIWGLVYLIGYGGIWLSVRGQRPYHAPTGLAAALLFVLVAVAGTATAAIRGRTRGGISGASTKRMYAFYIAIGVGVLGVLIASAVLSSGDASPRVVTFVGAAAPILLLGLAWSVLAIAIRRWVFLAFGISLIAAALLSTLAAPAAVWGILALAAGVAFLGAGAMQLERTRS